MLTSVRLVSYRAAFKPDALIVGVFTDKKLDPALKALDKGGVISKALSRPECTGDAGRIVEAFPDGQGAAAKRFIIIGLGKKEGFKPGSLRSIAGQIGRRLGVNKETSAVLALAPTLSQIKGIDLEHCGRCLGEGFGLVAWNFLSTRFKGTGTKNGNSKTAVSLSCSDVEVARGVLTGLELAASVNITRELSETPPNVATPKFITEFVKTMSRKAGLKYSVIEGAALEREKLAGLVNVGKASENKPCLIRMEYSPRSGKAGSKPVVLVGKTMTYDSGGLSLKVNNGMVGMKRDKDGGCAVIGAMHAIATVVKPNKRVVAYLAVAENSISDEAYRPDDVLTYRNGVTVEVTNTDAEGRLVLADALIYACEKDKPACIVDLATLTGGVVTALGSTFAGMFCEDEVLREKLGRAMEKSGERWWRLPMDQEYRDMMKSPIADIVNSNPNRKAHPIQGAAFLSYFVDENVPWAHLDIAGVHVQESDNGCLCKGSNGWGVRLIADFVGE